MTTGLPDEDLSDLGTPSRGDGLKDFFDTPGTDDPASVEEAPRRDERQEAPQPRVDKPRDAAPPEPIHEEEPPPPVQRRRNRKASPGGTATIYTSESVRSRLTSYRKKHDITNLVVVFQAIEQCGKLSEVGKKIEELTDEDLTALRETIQNAVVQTSYSGGLFSSNPKAVEYVGGGGAPSQFTPTPQQARELDILGEKLGFDKRSTWLAPVLNEFLPGRKDKR